MSVLLYCQWRHIAFSLNGIGHILFLTLLHRLSFFALAEEPGLEPRPTQGITCSGVRTLRADRYTTPLCAALDRSRTGISLLCLELREQITR